jgi:hypothetical protein
MMTTMTEQVSTPYFFFAPFQESFHLLREKTTIKEQRAAICSIDLATLTALKALYTMEIVRALRSPSPLKCMAEL